MDLFALVARFYVRFPLLWMLLVLGLTSYVSYDVYHANPTVDTSVDSFIVRGTLLSNRNTASGTLRRHLTHSPPHHWVPFPTETPAVHNETETPSEAPSTAAPPTPAPVPTPRPARLCSNRTRQMHLLVSDRGGGGGGGEDNEANVLSFGGLQRLCRVVETLRTDAAWQSGCGGASTDRNGTCRVDACEAPVYVLSLPALVRGGSSPALLRLLGFVRGAASADGPATDKLLDGIGALKLHCAAYGTVPCMLRARLTCEAPYGEEESCDAACLVADVDVCSLLVETDASADELRALARFPDPLAAAAGGGGGGGVNCDALTPEYTTALVGAAQVLASWAHRSSIASEMLPLQGGRALYDKAAVEAAAQRRVALGAMRSATTRVVLRLDAQQGRTAVVAAVRAVSRGAEDAAAHEGFDLAWREWWFFKEQMTDQLWLDGRWAVGSVVFVLAVVVAYSADLLMSLGAVVGVVLCLPLTFAVYIHVLGFRWVGVLHLIGLFMVAGVGADDFFVLLAHWREAERKYPEASEQDRLAWTMRHSLHTVAATSLTTAGAFLGNYASHIAPIKLFGLFMAVLMLSLLLSVALWFPPLLIVCSRADKWLHRTAARGDDGDDTCAAAVVRRLCAPCLYLSRNNLAFQRIGVAGVGNGGVGGDGGSSENAAVDASNAGAASASAAVPALCLNGDGDDESDLYSDDSNLLDFGGAPHTPSPTASASPTGRSAALRSNRVVAWVCRTVTTSYRAVAALSACVLVASVVLAINLPGPNGDLSLWPAGHNQARYMEREMEMDTDIGRADIRLTWGVAPADTGNRLDPASKSSLQLDPAFDVSHPDSQTLLLDVCTELLKANKDFLSGMVRSGTVTCPMALLDDFLREERNLSLPLPPGDFNDEVYNWWHARGYREGGYAGFYFRPGQRSRQPVAYTVWVGSTVDWRQPYSAVEPQWGQWEAWMDSRQGVAAHGFHSGGGAWVVMETQRELLRTAYLSLLVSLGLAFVIVAAATRNLALAAVAAGCIAGSVTTFVGFMTAAGWRLGVIESVCMTIVVGMSCDYVVHIATLHAHILEDGECASAGHTHRHVRSIRYVRKTVTLIGSPVMAAALTSVGAAAFLAGTTIVFLNRFGVFVVVTLISAAFYAIFAYSSVALTLSSFGADLHRLSWTWGGLCAARKEVSPETEALELDEGSLDRGASDSATLNAV